MFEKKSQLDVDNLTFGSIIYREKKREALHYVTTIQL